MKQLLPFLQRRIAFLAPIQEILDVFDGHAGILQTIDHFDRRYFFSENTRMPPLLRANFGNIPSRNNAVSRWGYWSFDSQSSNSLASLLKNYIYRLT